MHTRRNFIRFSAAALTAAITVPRNARSNDNPVRPTASGPVRGYLERGVRVFKGIRYGADTAARRFMPPVLPQPWTDVKDAFEYGASSPQTGSHGPQSEDCLFLNVWTPDSGDSTGRPVLVYLHGGAYSSGSGSSPLYDGCALSRFGDVVVVTINHRLNAFGYLYLQRFGVPNLSDSGNVGQLDILLALKWVAANISAFGGDPENVLVFGQSGGGAKIATMMAMPGARGLFHGAATMSGQQVTASGPAHAHQRALAYLDSLAVAPTEVVQLRTMAVEKLVEGLRTPDPVLPYGSLYFGPVLDMRHLVRHPFYPDAPNQSRDIPMMIGNTHDETRAFLRGPEYDNLTWSDLPELLLRNMRVDIRPEYVVDRYRELYPELTPTEVFFKATTASRSWRGAIIEAEERARQAGAATYVYQLDFRNEVQPELGAPHTLDIPLVFRNVGAEGSITGTSGNARRVSDLMSGALVAFARTGDPNHSGMPRWEPYSLERRQTMVFDINPRLVDDPRGAERRLFAAVPYIQPGT